MTLIVLMSWVNIQQVLSWHKGQKLDFKGKMFFRFQRQDEALFNSFIGQNMSQINGKIQILKIVKQNFAVEAATEICSFYRILERKK